MDVLIYLIPMALVLGGLWFFGFIWAMKSGQYDDMEGNALRIFAEDEVPKP